MSRLLSLSQLPLLTDVRVGISRQARSVSFNPYPIPDLFFGHPLVLSGQFSGTFPPHILLMGRDARRESFESRVLSRPADAIPIDRVFAKQRLDHLSTQAWLTGGAEWRRQAVDLSVRESIASPFTCMVAYETTDEAKQQAEKERGAAGTAVAIGGIVIGSIVVIATTALCFGDMSGSILGGIDGIDGACGGAVGCVCIETDCDGTDCCGGSDIAEALMSCEC